MNWEDKAFIRSSKIRQAILKALLAEELMPSELSKKLKISLPQISENLLLMGQKGFVECLTPNKHNYRIYGLTKKGKQFSKGV
ncbi:winged helix-turn-helix domain-containing protein [Patescibacteria group bacterium]|nr:winged helix-turn-helix domain-containing protein [Patescibacteria group bacterium]